VETSFVARRRFNLTHNPRAAKQPGRAQALYRCFPVVINDAVSHSERHVGSKKGRGCKAISDIAFCVKIKMPRMKIQGDPFTIIFYKLKCGNKIMINGRG
jgi:hypothetical protein